MNRFVGWLSEEWNWKRAIVGPLTVVLIWIALGYWIDPMPKENGWDSLTWSVLFFSKWQAVAAAFMEEVLFRFAPLVVMVAIFHKSRWLVAAMVIPAILFAVGHDTHDPLSLTMHTTFGFCAAVMFLKCGGFRENNWLGPAKALLTVAAMHWLCNIGGSLMQFSLGKWHA